MPDPSPSGASSTGTASDDRTRTPRLGTALGLLSGVRLVTNTGFRFAYPFLPVIARGLGIPLTQAGLLMSAREVAGMTIPLVVRVAGKGERRRRLAVAGLLLFALGTGVTAFTGVFAGALVGFAAIGMAKPAYDIASHSYLSDRTPYGRRARYLGTLELTWGGAMLLGAPAAGWLIDRYGWEAPFWAIAALAVVAALAIRSVLEPDVASMHRPDAAGLRLNRSAVALLAVMGLSSFGTEVSFVVFGAWLEDAFGLSVLALGGASTAIAAGEIAGSLGVLAFADRVGKRRMVLAGCALAVVGFGLLPFAATLVPGLAALALGLLGFEFVIVAAIPLATELQPQARSRYLALFVVAISLGRALGDAVGPAVFEGPGIAVNALISAVFNLAALVLLTLFVVEDTTAA